MKEMKRIWTCGLLLCSLSAGGRAETDRKAEEILRKTGAAYQNLGTCFFEANLVIEMNAQGMQNKMEIPIVLALSRPDKMRLEMKSMMMDFLAVSDGQTTWTFMPRLGQYTKRAAAPVLGGKKDGKQPRGMEAMVPDPEDLLAEVAEVGERVRTARILREEPLDVGGSKTDCYVLEVDYETESAPAEMEEETSPATLWIDKNRFLVLRKTVNSKMKSAPMGEMTMIQSTFFSRAELNAPVPETLFAFTPPSDAREVESLELPGMERADLTGQAADDFTLKDLTGKEVGLQNLKGKVVLLDFWASWCGPCRMELPHIQALHQAFKEKGLVVLGINGEPAEKAKKYMDKYAYTFPTLSDPERKVSEKYKVEALPTVVIIGRDGKIAAHLVGARDEKDLRQALQKAGIGE